ncbi:uncharacterized protein LOC108161222 [Drosophila miranda]|uniref:uncharacterized protein LOC108161222 n=1 Tax=Drosophila miranda TaxID=7229 RepID=UPI0007E631AC|nr:uncharacterized protein LOC108161222 [Drosophila miranda]
MLNFWKEVAKEQQVQQQKPAATQQQKQAAQPLAEQQQPQISAPSFIHYASIKQQQHLPTAQAQAKAEAYVSSPCQSEEQQHEQQTPEQQQQTPFEADLQQSLDCLMVKEEQPLPPLTPLSEAQEEQPLPLAAGSPQGGSITNPTVVDVLQSSSKLERLYVKLVARKNINSRMSASETRLICDGAIQMYKKEGMELNFSQCRELGSCWSCVPRRTTLFGAGRWELTVYTIVFVPLKEPRKKKSRKPCRSENNGQKQNVPLPHLPRPATETRRFRNSSGASIRYVLVHV